MFCEKCKEYVFEGMGCKVNCTCKDFIIIDEDGGEHTVRAKTEYSAAIQYAKDANTGGDYYLMDDSVEITVNGTKYSIGAEQSIEYSANRLII